MMSIAASQPAGRKVLAVMLAILAIAAVMIVSFRNGDENSASAAPATTRTYYIAADEVNWNYAPTGINQITGEPFGETENVFVQNGPERIGSTYTKALYREYTDATFTTLKPVDPGDAYLGTLGPILRGEVGDTIIVVFKNNTRFPASVHPHGVFYDKQSEGSGYNDGTSGAERDDDAVATGDTHTYSWMIPERAGPGPMDGSSIMWMYHSHVEEAGDTNAGLIGPIIVTAEGMGDVDGKPTDVDREIINLFTVFDENRSLYLDHNIATFTGKPNQVKQDDDFAESNLMHTINGFVYGNMPLMTMNEGESVRWYLMGMGTEVDLHTPHWHANTAVVMGMRTDVTELLPMSMKIADMVPDNPGIWFYHCHVNDHLDAGMSARFEVLP